MGPRAAPNPRVPGGASRLVGCYPGGSATLTALADMVRVGIGAIAAGFLVAGDESAALKTLLVFVPAIASRMVRAPAAFDLLFAVTLAVEALGTGLGVYRGVGWPNGGSHLLIPFVSAPIVYHGFVRLRATAAPEEPRAATGTGLMVAAGVLALGALWELVEWGADSVFGTDYSQGYTDTLSDLLADAFAASAGGVAIAVWRAGGRRPNEPQPWPEQWTSR